LKKGTDYSVPSRKPLISRKSVAVDRAVCPLFQQALRKAGRAITGYNTNK